LRSHSTASTTSVIARKNAQRKNKKAFGSIKVVVPAVSLLPTANRIYHPALDHQGTARRRAKRELTLIRIQPSPHLRYQKLGDSGIGAGNELKAFLEQ
jgi:hypothetical protein